MKRLIGIVLFVAGLVGSLIFGLDAFQKTESVKLFGNTITLSQADWTPFFICLAITLAGVILILSYKPKSRTKGRKK